MTDVGVDRCQASSGAAAAGMLKMDATREASHDAWRPDPAQTLLLEACLGPRERAAEAFARWRRTIDLKSIDAGSQRLLPLLVPRANLFDSGDAAWPVIRGVYRRAFVHAHLLGRRGGAIVDTLSASGIPAMVLKGAALIAYYRNQPALRPMNDFDVLVPREHARKAIAVLEAMGWRTGWPCASRLPEVYHGAAFRPADGLELDLDLHWSVLPADDGAHDRALWTDAVRCVLPGTSTLAPCAEDLLVIVCAHATGWMPIPALRWVADALRILEARGGGIDWNRVTAAARAWRVTLQLADTLTYLATNWRVAVPAPTLERLRSTVVDEVDRRAYRGLASRPRLGAYLMRPWRRYRLRSRSVPAWRALPGFVRYLEVTLGRSHWSALPVEILRRLLRFRRLRRGPVR